MSVVLVPVTTNTNEQAVMPKTWSQIQDSLMGTRQNSKTGGDECDYSSKVTGS